MAIKFHHRLLRLEIRAQSLFFPSVLWSSISFMCRKKATLKKVNAKTSEDMQ